MGKGKRMHKLILKAAFVYPLLYVSLFGTSLELVRDENVDTNIIVISPTCDHCANLVSLALEYYLHEGAHKDLRLPKVLISDISGSKDLVLSILSFLHSKHSPEEQLAFFEVVKTQLESASPAEETIKLIESLFPRLGQSDPDLMEDLYDLHQSIANEHPSPNVPYLISNGMVHHNSSIAELFSPNLTKPVLVPSQETLNLGEVSANLEVVEEFTLTNAGNATAYLTDSGVGFPNSSFVFEKSVLPPNESTKVKLSWIPGDNFTGLMSFKTHYSSKKDKRATFDLTIHASRSVNSWLVPLDDTYISIEQIEGFSLSLFSNSERSLSDIKINDDIPNWTANLFQNKDSPNSFALKFSKDEPNAYDLLYDKMKMVNNPYIVTIEDNNSKTKLRIYILKPQKQSLYIPTLIDATHEN